jgi:hypothetical protein
MSVQSPWGLHREKSDLKVLVGFILHGFRELLEAPAVDYIQFGTNRVGGLSQARKIAALAEAHSVPVIPHAGQMRKTFRIIE